MDNVRKALSAVNEELFPDDRQRPLGQSPGGHNDPLLPLQVNNDDDTDDSDKVDNAADDGDEADNADADCGEADNTEADEEAADGDDAGDGSDNNADDKVDSNDMADPEAAAAAGGGAGRTKPIIPTFAGKGNNIFKITTLAQEFIDSVLGYCQHARITQDKRLGNFELCLTGVAKKWYRTETKFVGNFTD